jgi:hypothetical protein
MRPIYTYRPITAAGLATGILSTLRIMCLRLKTFYINTLQYEFG